MDECRVVLRYNDFACSEWGRHYDHVCEPMWRLLLACLVACASSLTAQQTHSHGVPVKLGLVSFSVSCNPGVQQQFNRAVALLHCFAYAPAADAFRGIAKQAPQCAM